MQAEEKEILESIKDLKGETLETYEDELDKAPVLVKDTLTSSVEVHSGISVKACINYESISSNLKKRDFLIRRVVKNKDEYFIDGLALDINAPRLIRVSQIFCITDVVTGIAYSDAYAFLQNVLGIPVEDSYLPEPMSDFAKAVNETSSEITLLMYLVALDGKRMSKERQCVLKYIRSRVPYLNYDDVEMNDYLISLAPDDDSFSMAFHRVLKKGKLVVEPLLQAILNIITVDGVVHEREKAFLARIIEWLKQDGYQINVTEEK